ncbi:MAG: hypothetical protein JW810_13425 [Sedimentisphaerales bacterium]|nr:hypothetical protein [Sedimentisphaerales bacterium]
MLRGIILFLSVAMLLMFVPHLTAQVIDNGTSIGISPGGVNQGRGTTMMSRFNRYSTGVMESSYFIRRRTPDPLSANFFIYQSGVPSGLPSMPQKLPNQAISGYQPAQRPAKMFNDLLGRSANMPFVSNLSATVSPTRGLNVRPFRPIRPQINPYTFLLADQANRSGMTAAVGLFSQNKNLSQISILSDSTDISEAVRPSQQMTLYELADKAIQMNRLSLRTTALNRNPGILEARSGSTVMPRTSAARRASSALLSLGY